MAHEAENGEGFDRDLILRAATSKTMVTSGRAQRTLPMGSAAQMIESA